MDDRASRSGPGVAALLAGLSLAGPAAAQFPDVLSDTECPGCRAQLAPTPFEGTWSTALTAADDPGWALEDLFCVTACTAEGRAQTVAVLADPRNAQRPAVALAPQLDAVNVRALRFGCDALGFAEQIVSPLPLSIRREGNRLVLRYEERGVERAIALGGREPVAAGPDARLGASTGRFEDGVLIVTTRTATLHAIERYSVSADGRWLTLALEVRRVDSREPPLFATKRWLRSPDARLASHGCDAMSAGLTATLWDYVDPRIVDARRAEIATRLTRRGE
jgi:hypothetical protein